MAKISLLEKVIAISTLDLEFTSLTIQKTADGKSRIAVLQLAEPIEFVRGSQEVDTGDGILQGMTATDVTEVKVIEDDFDKIDWDDTTDTGSYMGDGMVLDVAKRTGQVWLKTVPFSASAAEFRRTNQQSNLQKMLARTGMGKTEPATAASFTPVEQ